MLLDRTRSELHHSHLRPAQAHRCPSTMTPVDLDLLACCSAQRCRDGRSFHDGNSSGPVPPKSTMGSSTLPKLKRRYSFRSVGFTLSWIVDSYQRTITIGLPRSLARSLARTLSVLGSIILKAEQFSARCLFHLQTNRSTEHKSASTRPSTSTSTFTSV